MLGFLKSIFHSSDEQSEINSSNIDNISITMKTNELNCFVDYMRSFRMMDDYFEEHEYDQLKHVVLLASKSNVAVQNLIRRHPSKFSNYIMTISDYFKAKTSRWYDKQTSFSWIYRICTYFAFFYGSNVLESLVNRVHDSQAGFILNNDGFFKQSVRALELYLKEHLVEIGVDKTSEDDLIKFYVNLSTVLQLKAFESDLRKNINSVGNSHLRVDDMNNEKSRAAADFLLVGCAFLISLDTLLPNVNINDLPSNYIDRQINVYILYLKVMTNLAYGMTEYIRTVQNEKVSTIFSIDCMSFILDNLIKQGAGFEYLYKMSYSDIIEEYNRFKSVSK